MKKTFPNYTDSFTPPPTDVNLFKNIIENRLEEKNTDIVRLIPNFDEHINDTAIKMVKIGLTLSDVLTGVQQIDFYFKRVTNEEKLIKTLSKIIGASYNISRGLSPEVQKIKSAIKTMYRIEDNFASTPLLKQNIENLEICFNVFLQHGEVESKEQAYKELVAKLRWLDHNDIDVLTNYLESFYVKAKSLFNDNIKVKQKKNNLISKLAKIIGYNN